MKVDSIESCALIYHIKFIFENIFVSFIIVEHWDVTFCWNPSSWLIRIHLACVINAIATDAMAIHGTRALAAMVLTNFSWNILIPAPESFLMTSSNENIFCVTGYGDQWIPRTKASDADLWCFFDRRPNNQLSKQSWGWWFEMPSCPLWCHCNVMLEFLQITTRWTYIIVHVYIHFTDSVHIAKMVVIF